MSDELRFDRSDAALVITDIQPDFLPGGALPVPDGDAILEPLTALLERDPFSLYVATQDWHPPGHVSFASSHPGRKVMEVIEIYGRPQRMWPDHCVQGTPGAALHSMVPNAMLTAIVRKATDPMVDSYSTFRNNWDATGQRPPTGLGGYLKERGIGTVFLCGLARDYCVKWSAEDAAAVGFRTFVLWDLTRPIDPASDERVRQDLERVGVRIIHSDGIPERTVPS